MTGRISEGSTYQVEATFIDSDGEIGMPQGVRYQIVCLTSGKLVRDWTTVTPSTTVTITATVSDNAIQSDKNVREKKQLVVESTTPDGLVTTGHVEWLVDNLRGVR